MRARFDDVIDSCAPFRLQARSPDSGLSDNTPMSDQVSMLSAYDRKGVRGASQGRTELHKAARRGNIDDVRAAIESGLRTTAVDDDGATPLHDAANCDEPGAEEVSGFLSMATYCPDDSGPRTVCDG